MRKFIFIFLLVLPMYTSAASTNTLNAVTMVAYEQGWLDSEGTLALKNNTNVPISNLTYRIKYFDMNGKELDYKEYTSEVDIAPGRTKKVNIPAYEHERFYSYYKSEGTSSNPHKFNISFSLVSYNSDLSPTDETMDEYGAITNSHNDKSSSDLNLVIIIIVVVLFILGISVGLYVLVALMAKHRNRNIALWVLVSLLGTPLLAIIILLCIGTEYNSNDDSDE